MGKIKVHVTRLAPLRASTKGKPGGPLESYFSGQLYKLIKPFRNNKYLTILEQKACIPAESLRDALSVEPARILVYNDIGGRQIESSDIVKYEMQGENYALVDTENYRYEIRVDT